MTNMDHSETFLGKLADIQDRYIYFILAIVLIVPLLHPFGLPVPITSQTIKFYNAINSLKPGDTVFYAFDASSMTWIEQGLGATVVLKHLLEIPGVKIVTATISPEGPMFWENTLNSLNPAQYGKKYGTDIVNLGFFPGVETACSTLGKDIKAATGGVDAYGNKFDTLPLMSTVNKATDFKLLIVLSYGSTCLNWMDQWQMPYGIPEYVIPLSALVASITPNIQAGQIQAIINGARGAAEYELLLKQPGLAASGMDAQSLGHIYVAILIIVGNIGFFAKKGGKK